MNADRLLRIGLVVLVVIGMSSCSVFRKKNRCNTCPVWKDQIELEERFD